VGSQIAFLRIERDGARPLRIELGSAPIASPVMSCCQYYSRGPHLRYGGVGGANSRSQCEWHLARRCLPAPTSPVLPA
jgi:hypothetical protein